LQDKNTEIRKIELDSLSPPRYSYKQFRPGLGGESENPGLERRMSKMHKIKLTIHLSDGTIVEITVTPP
jgi:hypothetical protein